MVKRRSCYSIDCEGLSCLDNPLGLQGLASALEQGASRWSVRDTIRVAEALLDAAFFSRWVEGRYWSYHSRRGYDWDIKVDSFTNNQEHRLGDSIVSSYNLPDWDEDQASFQFDYHGIGVQLSEDSVVEYVSTYAIEMWGYDQSEANRLQHLYEQQGSRVLLAS